MTNLSVFLFFFPPSLFMIFHSSSISQRVVFKKQGLINEVSDTGDIMRILALFAAFKLAMVFSIFLIFVFTISVILLIVNNLYK